MDERFEKNKLSGIFTDHKDPPAQIPSPTSVQSQNQFYAVGAPNGVIKRFKIFLRDGSRYSIPYSLLPVLILQGGKEITILAYELQITINGRNLHSIEDHLSNETLLWLKESASGKDEGAGDVFISDIKIEGKTVNN